MQKKWNNDRAHAAAVLEKRLYLRYGTSDVSLAWRRTLATFRTDDRVELEAIRLCGAAHPELAAAYARRAARPIVPPVDIDAVRALAAQKVVRGQSHYSALCDAIKEIRKG